ncbi:hypothetical protein sos41_17110 [Alphaproteobacteria bacterium SO-S41]|nr:hypothetical protein sos41_17110 [Alphaproteobacteria bacterium SO-S41]
MTQPFETDIAEENGALTGPWRGPRQMLAAQEYGGHASIHDDATAQKLGFKGGTIEGPTHFSQVVPLGVKLWGERFLSEGNISAHYRNACFEGDKVRALVTVPEVGATQAELRLEREDGVEVLKGTIGVGGGDTSALTTRLSGLPAPHMLVVLRDVRVGMKTPRQSVTMGADQNMGALYPFSLSQKLERITENSPWYASGENPFGRAIVPFEMVSVLLNHVGSSFPVKGPAVGLFADQEIRMVKGPLFVGAPYEIEREVVGLSESKRTESMWVLTKVFAPGGSDMLATMLLNSATMKESYAPYADEAAELKRMHTL